MGQPPRPHGGLLRGDTTRVHLRAAAESRPHSSRGHRPSMSLGRPATGPCPAQGTGRAGVRKAHSRPPVSPSIRPLDRRGHGREARGHHVRSRFRSSLCVLQFTSVNAAGCALHRCTSDPLLRVAFSYSTPKFHKQSTGTTSRAGGLSPARQ